MLTLEQKQTLKAAIQAETNATFVGYRNNGDTSAMADWLNKSAPGPVKAWRNDVSNAELVEATVENLALYDGLTPGKRDAWQMFLTAAPIDMTRNKYRAAPGKVWAPTQRDNILADPGTRNATRAEVMLGGTDVTEGGVTAKKMNWYGELSYTDIIDILAV
ncbi:MAG: hypothetical protein HXY24_18795 [Rubrivivax sp.]|nr:hypothetical protein [Rubrivivax sp.]